MKRYIPNRRGTARICDHGIERPARCPDCEAQKESLRRQRESNAEADTQTLERWSDL